MPRKKHPLFSAIAAIQNPNRPINRVLRDIDAAAQAAEDLSRLNTSRGGKKGFKGFVHENMQAYEATTRGHRTAVLDDNGISDLVYTKADGTKVYQQLKLGYQPGQIDFSRYSGQTVVVNPDHPRFQELKEAGAAAGVNVVKGHVASGDAQRWADAMQLESKITGSSHSSVVPKLYEGAKTLESIGRLFGL